MARVFDVGQEAYGIIAIGQTATGVIAVGQMATGVIAIGQVARGGIAIGMGAIGIIAIGMGACGLVWCGGMLAIGGRVAFGITPLSLSPVFDEGFARRPTWWIGGVAQCVGLAAAAVAFWLLAGLPVGDALWGPAGLLK
jgi:hypothetical protein